MGTPMTRPTRPAARSPSRGAGHPSRALPRIAAAPLMLALTLLASASSCSRADDLPEWSPADHDHTASPSSGQVDTSQASPLSQHGISDVVLATWRQNCVTCHGIIGQGDGPQGKALRPPDFTQPLWQKNALDDHMRRTITKGRGAMPAFGHLPDGTVDGLVRLIRLLNRDRKDTPSGAANGAPAAAPEGAPSPAPEGSAKIAQPGAAAATSPAPTPPSPPSAAPAAEGPANHP